MRKNSILGLVAIALICAVLSLQAQQPDIQALSRNGVLTTTGLVPGSGATVEWAPRVTGPWKDTWSGLRSVEADANGAIQLEVPMFYRIRVSNLNPDPSRLVWIPRGTFIMGSPLTEAGRQSEELQHEVTISRGFWMGKHEVTQQEYMDVIGSNPSRFDDDPSLPVEQVNWSDAFVYCLILTAQERSAGRLTSDHEYRLPTEAEWEYACRAGTTTRFSFGEDTNSTELTDFGWFKVNGGAARPVGGKLPNPWGLYDMHGNVWEWCQDWCGDYPAEPVTDPKGPGRGSRRTIRGGSVLLNGELARSASRCYYLPGDEDHSYGFRVVLAPVQE